MCLCVKDYWDSPIEVASTPITVWKVLNGNRSPYRHRLYKPNQMAHANRVLKVRDGKVEYGLHAFTSFEAADNSVISLFGAAVIVKMTIPKGAKYVLGCDYDIVSNMMFTGTMKAIARG